MLGHHWDPSLTMDCVAIQYIMSGLAIPSSMTIAR